MAPDYLIKVHSQHPKDGLIFPLQFKKKRETKVIHLYWNGDKHYGTVTKVTGLMGCNYYCEYCDKGCYWHGCPTHYPDRETIHKQSCQTMGQLYTNTNYLMQKFKDNGYLVIEMWESEYDRKYKEDEEFRKTVDSHFTKLDPLRSRDALFGGRTNSIKLYHEIDETSQDEIKYIDVCSLYPSVCKYGLFPLGHPTILSQEHVDKDNIEQYEGLIKCKVLPPTNLFHPVLPYKCNNKLMFPLCRTYAERCDPSQKCTHSEDDERALVGTWVSIELKAALEKGYELLDFPETTQYDKKTGEGGISMSS